MAICLVTGGAGFLGSHLVTALVEAGHAVRVLDNFSTGSPENLAHVEDRVDMIRGSVTDFALVRQLTDGAEYVFHLAAPPVDLHDQDDAMEAHYCGATGTLHVLLAAREAGVRRVLYASSSYVYGPPGGAPRQEDEHTRPLSAYGVAKLTGEQQCVAFTARHGLETVRLRYFNVFGPRQPPGSPYSAALSLMIRQMLAGVGPVMPGGPAARQDWIAVDDAVYATLLAAGARRAAGRVYNVAGGRGPCLLEVVDLLNALLGTHLEPLTSPAWPGEEVYNLADTRKAEAELGFCPGMDLEKGLRQCVQFFLLRHERAVPPALT